MRRRPGAAAARLRLQRRRLRHRHRRSAGRLAQVRPGPERAGLPRSTGRAGAKAMPTIRPGTSPRPPGPRRCPARPGATPGPAGATPGHDAQGPREVTGTLITRAGNVRYRHDRQGRVVQRQVIRISRKPDTWHYHWDADSRLAAVTTPDHTTWRYRYDPFGRRIAKQRLTPDGDIAEQTDFTWDGTVLAEQATTTTAQPGQHQVITWDYRPGSFTPLTQAEHTSPGELSEAPQEQIDQRFYSIIADLIGTPAELAAPDGTLAGCQRHTLWGTTVWDPRRRPDPAPVPRPVRRPGDRPALQPASVLRPGGGQLPDTRPARPDPCTEPARLRHESPRPGRPPGPSAVSRDGRQSRERCRLRRQRRECSSSGRSAHARGSIIDLRQRGRASAFGHRGFA